MKKQIKSIKSGVLDMCFFFRYGILKMLPKIWKPISSIWINTVAWQSWLNATNL